MITTLYFVTVASWLPFKDFDGEFQIKECQALRARLETNFDVTATCLSKDGSVMIHDNRTYDYAERRKQEISLYTLWDGSSEKSKE